MSVYGFLIISLCCAARGLADSRAIIGIVPLIYSGAITYFVSGRLFGVRLTHLSLAAVVVLFGLAFVGFRRSASLEKISPTLLLCASVPAVLLWAKFYWGLQDYIGSWYFDGWNYVVYAQYLLDQGKLFLDSSPLYLQFAASGMTHTRFASSALIGFFSLISGSPDAFGGKGLFLAITIFVFCCSCFYLVAALRLGFLSGLAVIFISSTTILSLVQVNNFDTLLLISIAPACAACMVEAQPKHRYSAVAVGLYAAAMVCTQIELLAAAALPAFSIFAARLRRDGLRPWLRWTGIAGALFLLFCGRWLPQALLFLQAQLLALRSTTLPGSGYFQTLLDGKCWLPAAWGLYNPYQVCIDVASPLVVAAVLLSAMAMIGAASALQHREIRPIAFAAILLFVLGSWVSLGANYGYGAFKFFAMAAPFIGALTAFAASRSRVSLALCAALFLILGPIITNRSIGFDGLVKIKGIDAYRQIAGTEQHIDNLAHGDLLLWSLFFLRQNLPAESLFDQPLLVHAKSAARSAGSDKPDFVVTDPYVDLSCGGSRLLRGSNTFRIWQVEGSPVRLVGNIDARNGVEADGSERSLWLDGSDAVFEIESREEGPAIFMVDVKAGPSLPESSLRSIEYRHETIGKITFDGEATVRIPLMVRKGTTKLVLRALDQPTLAALPNGDPRQLLNRLTRIRVC